MSTRVPGASAHRCFAHCCKRATKRPKQKQDECNTTRVQKSLAASSKHNFLVSSGACVYGHTDHDHRRVIVCSSNQSQNQQACVCAQHGECTWQGCECRARNGKQQRASSSNNARNAAEGSALRVGGVVAAAQVLVAPRRFRDRHRALAISGPTYLVPSPNTQAHLG
eukprot:6194121-Pleurochrysis_carterae.AAC.2